jgi:hypothetical protein
MIGELVMNDLLMELEIVGIVDGVDGVDGFQLFNRFKTIT